MQERQQPISKVTIHVSDPEVKKQYGGAKVFYLYSIKGQDSKGAIDIQRRYSDFDLLKNLLIKRWPGCYIPSLPSKVKLSNSNQQFLQTRSKYLRLFLMQLSKRQYMWNSDQVQLFLRNKSTDFDKSIYGLWKIQLSELAYRYINQFQHLQTHEQQKLETKISQFSKYLQVLYIKIQQLKNRSRELNDSQARYQKKFSKFLLNTLVTYEQKFLTYYNEGNNDFNPIFLAKQNLDMKADLQESLKEIPLKILFEQIKRQKRQIFSIQQSLKQYEQYVKQKFKIEGKIKDHQLRIAQIQNGKQSLFSKLKNVFTDDQIKNHEKSIQKYKSQLESYEKILKIMRILLAESEIQYFKKERTSSYYKMVQEIAREELVILEKERTFWLSVCKNNNVSFQIDQKEQKPIFRTKKQIPKQVRSQKQINQKPQKNQQVEQVQLPSVQQHKNDKFKDQTIDQLNLEDKSEYKPKKEEQKISKSQKNLRLTSKQHKNESKQAQLKQERKMTKIKQKQAELQNKALKQLKNATNEKQSPTDPLKLQKQSEIHLKVNSQGIENDEFQQIETTE